MYTEFVEQLNELVSTHKIALALCLLGVVLIIGGIYASNIKPKTNFPKESLVSSSSKPTASEIKVDVSGAVLKPGVYSLAVDSRVEDAIKIAGGFSEGVNKAFVAKSLNLSEKVGDGSKIYVPFISENSGGVVLGTTVTGTSSNKLDINKATQRELEALPGIGAVSAGKIIAGRPYAQITELTSKKIITKTVFDKIKETIAVN